ncbi:MAG: dethiobiotin synthase [Deltaproteobacteria bacterium]|nr:dethiobiotin synthase [Deltaproteobacteria bacterium]
MSAAETPQGLFITGTDTGVGKTLVAAALAKLLSERHINVGVMKPAESGVDDPRQLGADAKLLKWAADSPLPDAQICPYRLRAPLAPAVAAAKEKIRIDYSNLVQQAQQIISDHEFTLIEGAGGLMTPLAGGLLMADFARAIGLPLLVVCRPDLGTVNHTLLTLFSARNMDLPTAGYLINNMPVRKTAAEETAAHTLASLTSEELVGILGAVEGDDRRKVAQLAEQIAALPTLSLLAKYLPTAFAER